MFQNLRWILNAYDHNHETGGAEFAQVYLEGALNAHIRDNAKEQQKRDASAALAEMHQADQREKKYLCKWCGEDSH